MAPLVSANGLNVDDSCSMYTVTASNADILQEAVRKIKGLATKV